MTDDERIARLVELARRVWPELERSRVWTSEGCCAELELDDEGLTYIHIHPHPRALDALEAALLVLAGEPPAWADELAREWEADAKQLHGFAEGKRHDDEARERLLNKKDTLGECAEELRERAAGAKGEG
jgi:hypothetical protein